MHVPPMTRNQVIDLLTWIEPIDGHERGRPDINVWHEVALRSGWTFDAALEVVQSLAQTFTGYHVMPGHVQERLRVDSRHPAPNAHQRALSAAPVPSDERRAQHLATVVDLISRKKAIPTQREATDEAEAQRRRELARLARWAAIDTCKRCDASGQELDADGAPTELVCSHRERPADGATG